METMYCIILFPYEKRKADPILNSNDMIKVRNRYFEEKLYIMM